MSATEKLLADFLTQDEAGAELKVCGRTLDRWRRLGEGPPITKLGRRILYRRSSVHAWLRAREHRGHGDDGANIRRDRHGIGQLKHIKQSTEEEKTNGQLKHIKQSSEEAKSYD